MLIKPNMRKAHSPIDHGLAIYRWAGLVQRFGNVTRKRSLLPPTAKIPARALLIWRERPDLRHTYDLETRAGRENLVLWYIRHGFSELGLAADPSDNTLIKSLSEPSPRTRQRAFLPISWLMRLCVERYPAQEGFSLRRAECQHHFLCWFFAHALAAVNLQSFLTVAQAAVLLAPSDGESNCARIFDCIWTSTPALHTRFAGPSDSAFHEWCLSEQGLRSFPVLSHPLIGLAPRPTRGPVRRRPFGVNLFGHGYARSGISEDMRMACETLKAAGVPFVIRNVAPGSAMPEEDMATTEQDKSLPYAINIFCMPWTSTVTAVSALGREHIADYYSIGFWPWELPEMPPFWTHAYHFVDEVWASTQFTCAAFRRSSPHPVQHVPFAVDASQSDGLDRDAFGLPLRTFLFGFAFDGLSGFARKAPLLTIKAFQQAFKRDDRSVGLVIKGLRADKDRAWRELVDAVGDDDRVHFITSSLPRGGLLDLWRSLDCFLSLHRSEGFGRNIAETMLVGRPVIATAHSGNMDFTNHETAALVPCSLRPVVDHEYPFSTGQLWAEPDLDAASDQMIKIVNDNCFRSRISDNGKYFISKNYNISVISKLWMEHLKKIYNCY